MPFSSSHQQEPDYSLLHQKHSGSLF